MERRLTTNRGESADIARRPRALEIKRDSVFIKEISKFRRCIDHRFKSSIYELLLPECWIVHYGRDIFMQPIDNRRRRC